MEYVIAFCVVCGIVGAIIGSAKNAGTGGFFLGLLLGPLGVLAAFTIDGRPKCETCKSPMDPEAQQCPQCLSVKNGKSDSRRQMSTTPVGVEPPEDDQEATHRIRFICKGCNKKLSWPANEAGNKILCDECGAPNTVPDAFGTRSKKPANVIDCPDCGKTVSKRAETCPHCGCPVGSLQ